MVAVIRTQRGEDLRVAHRRRPRAVKSRRLQRSIPGPEPPDHLARGRPPRTLKLPSRAAPQIDRLPVDLHRRSSLDPLPGADRGHDLPLAERLTPPRAARARAAPTPDHADRQDRLPAALTIVDARVAPGGIGRDPQQLADLPSPQSVRAQPKRLPHPFGERQLDHRRRREPGQRQHLPPPAQMPADHRGARPVRMLALPLARQRHGRASRLRPRHRPPVVIAWRRARLTRPLPAALDHPLTIPRIPMHEPPLPRRKIRSPHRPSTTSGTHRHRRLTATPHHTGAAHHANILTRVDTTTLLSAYERGPGRRHPSHGRDRSQPIHPRSTRHRTIRRARRSRACPLRTIRRARPPEGRIASTASLGADHLAFTSIIPSRLRTMISSASNPTTIDHTLNCSPDRAKAIVRRGPRRRPRS